MNKVFIKDGKAILYDDRWVTIGGEDEDGSGQHVLIKENGTIVAGFGKGKNVKNAFSETNKESGGGAKPEAKSEEPKKDYEKEAREAVEYWHKTHYSKETGENIRESVENVRSQMESRLRKAEKNLRDAKQLGKPEIEKEFQDKYDEAKGQLDALNKYYDGGAVKETNAPKKEPFTKKYKFNSPEEEEANRKAKAEIFRQANEESKRKQAEKDRKDKIEARKELKRAEAGLAEAKAKGDGKAQSFWEATRNRAENTLGKSSDPERQIKLLERERDSEYDKAETDAERNKVFNKYKRKIDAIRNPKLKANEPKPSLSEMEESINKKRAEIKEAKRQRDIELAKEKDIYKGSKLAGQHREKIQKLREDLDMVRNQYGEASKAELKRKAEEDANRPPLDRLRSQHMAIVQREKGYNNQIAEMEKKNPTERNKARLEKLKSERDEMTKRKNDVLKQIENHPDYEKPTSATPQKVVRVEPNKVTITKSAEGYEGEKSDLLEKISDLNWQIASKPGDRMTPYKRQLREDMRKRLREIMEAEKANK